VATWILACRNRATDNGAGRGSCDESHAHHSNTWSETKRTIRIGLWTGEEEGLLGFSCLCEASIFGTLEPGNSGVVPPGNS